MRAKALTVVRIKIQDFCDDTHTVSTGKQLEMFQEKSMPPSSASELFIFPLPTRGTVPIFKMLYLRQRDRHAQINSLTHCALSLK
jgi:hypothetical protein